MPSDNKEKTILTIKKSLRKKHPSWSEEKVVSTAYKIYNARVKAKTRNKEFLTLKEEDEEFRVFGYIATTHKDLDGQQILPETLYKWADDINGNFPESGKGDLHHDRTDVHLVSVAEYAEVIDMDDGHKGLWVSDFVNAKHPQYDTIKYEIEHNFLPAYSIEFDERNVIRQGSTEYITPECDLWGYAHASRPVNTQALKTGLKELPKEKSFGKFNLVNKEEQEVKHMTEENIEKKDESLDLVKKELEEVKQKLSETLKAKEVKEEKEEASPLMGFKEELEDLKLQMKEFSSSLMPEKKPILAKKETDNGLSLRFKEMKNAVDNKDWMGFKEIGMNYLEENSEEYALKMKEEGLPLRTTMKMRCKGTGIEIVSAPQLKFKDILDTGSNSGTYTESPVEFADIFQPGIVDKFNNAQGLMGEMLKIDNLEGTKYYGFTIETDRNTAGGAVDPDDVTVETGFIPKLKCRQEIKVYRYGVSVSDYTLWHSRASLGRLFELEVQKAMEAWMNKVHADLFREGVGTDGTDPQILGLEAVADSAGNTTLYGHTRSSYPNVLAPDAAADTYLNNNGSMVAAELRLGMDQLETEGSRFEDIRLVVSPTVRSYLFNLEDTNIRYFGTGTGAPPGLGFNQGVRPYWDGVPVIVDHKCTSTLGNPAYVIDVGRNGFIMVVSKPPQLTGLAKVSAAQSAYVEGYITTVYGTPRRIYLYDNNSGPTS